MDDVFFAISVAMRRTNFARNGCIQKLSFHLHWIQSNQKDCLCCSIPLQALLCTYFPHVPNQDTLPRFHVRLEP